jgi:hypothetical protein
VIKHRWGVTVGAALRGRPFVESKRSIERVVASRMAQTNVGNLDLRQGAATECRPYSTFHEVRCKMIAMKQFF